MTMKLSILILLAACAAHTCWAQTNQVDHYDPKKPASLKCKGENSCCDAQDPCAEGDGDCDADTDCDGNLVCGSNNCNGAEFMGFPGRESAGSSEFSVTDDCCALHPALWPLPTKEAKNADLETVLKCKGGDDCCSSENQCGLGDGDCDSDDDCDGELVCGSNNCMGYWFQWDDDCCRHAKTK